MKCQLAQDDNLTHQSVIDMANTCILEYQATYPTLAAKQQPTLSYGLAYLQRGNTIINERYNEAILHSYNWPKFTTSFYGVTAPLTQYTGKPLNIKGRSSASPAARTYSSLCMNGYQLVKCSSPSTTLLHQNAHLATPPLKPIITSFGALTPNSNKSPTNAWPKSNSSTHDGNFQKNSTPTSKHN
jgi:hypothetical protein